MNGNPSETITAYGDRPPLHAVRDFAVKLAAVRNQVTEPTDDLDPDNDIVRDPSHALALLIVRTIDRETSKRLPSRGQDITLTFLRESADRLVELLRPTATETVDRQAIEAATYAQALRDLLEHNDSGKSPAGTAKPHLMTVAWTVARLVDVVVWALPVSHRARYGEEFRAEIYDLIGGRPTRWSQIAYVARLLARVHELRSALPGPTVHRRPYFSPLRIRPPAQQALDVHGSPVPEDEHDPYRP